MTGSAAWLTLAGLGAYHGVNPAMGWLFAVSRGMTERSRGALVRSLAPIAIGHELSIALVAALVVGLSATIDTRPLHIGAAAALLGFGIFRFAKPRAHPRWTTMRVNDRELTLWSFLMSSAHGAGLMVAPILIGLEADSGADHHKAETAMMTTGPIGTSAVGVTLHVATMLVVMAAVALFVYERIGVQVLRRAWINTDHLWAAAFIVAAVVTFVS